MYLVINNKLTKYTDKYKLFVDENKAIEMFKEYCEGNYFMSINTTPGMMNSLDDGDFIGLINLIEEK